jgi:hypothetical protein
VIFYHRRGGGGGLLAEGQIEKVWERMLAAEVRSMYFGDLATRYSRRKQLITGVSFFLSSGAAATLVGKAPGWVPLVLSIVAAVLGAYSMAVSLERAVRTMAKLHYSWNHIAADYDRLWNHSWDDDAEDEFGELIRRERDLSELACTEAPNNQHLLEKWQDYVFRMHHWKDHEPQVPVETVSKA